MKMLAGNPNENLHKRCMDQEQIIADLQQKVAKLSETNAELLEQNRLLQEQLGLLLRQRFAPSRESLKAVVPEQEKLFFNEAEATADPQKAEPEIEEVVYQRRKKRSGQRDEMLEGLPERIVEHDLPEEEKICSCCGGALHRMSEEIRREIEIIPAQAHVIKHVRHVYACRECEKNETTTPILTAPMPNPVIPNSIASPSAVAFVACQKYAEGLPLYRQEKQLAHFGLRIPRQTLANWMIKGADWLDPLYDRMHQHLLSQDVLHADETTVQVLKEPERVAQTKSYMWLYRSGRDGPPIVLFDYQRTRSGKHARGFLSGFSGYLHVDGYAGYNKMAEVVLVGCWAHARRKFFEALEALPPGVILTKSAAKQGVDFCDSLFKIERQITEATNEERYRIRQEQSRPVLAAMKEWLDQQQPLSKFTLGQAIGYCRNQWDKLNAYLKDGRLEISNNIAERAIRPFAIGRKNWLFSDTPKGAKASARIYSIIETAKENSLNPYSYLAHLFEELPNRDLTDVEALDDLMPWSSRPQDLYRGPIRRPD
jgi:transposase